MSLLEELKRRNVLRVATAYIVSAWLIIQVVETVLPPFGFTENAFRTTVLVLAVGFIPVIVLAWVFEWTPGGVVRDDGADRPAARDRKLDRAIIVVLLLGIIYFAIDKYVVRVEPTDFYGDRSIAVLPFDNMSPDPEQVFFADGVTEEVLNLLARIRSLRVTHPSSSFAFRGHDQTEKEIAARLTVGYLLTGTVRRAGNRVRVRTQLFEGSANAIRWSKVYEREVGDVFLIQDEIAADVVRNLRLTLSEPLAHSQQVDPEALALVQRARQIYEERGGSEGQRMLPLLERALEIEPDYVRAIELTLLADWFRWGHGVLGEEERLEREAIFENRIRELDPGSSFLDAGEAWDFMWAGDYESAAPLYISSMEKGLTDVTQIRGAAFLAVRLEKLNLALRLLLFAESMDPMCLQCKENLARVLMLAGDYEAALEVSLQYMSEAEGGELQYALLLLLNGQADEAMEVLESLGGDYGPSGMLLSMEAMVKWSQGNAEGADALYQALEDDLQRSIEAEEEWLHMANIAYSTAKVAAWTNRVDRAFELLLPLAGAPFNYPRMEVGSPEFENLWGDPRWLEYKAGQGQAPERIAAIEFDPWLPE